MKRKVMIAPVGYYEERLLRSIVAVGPSKLYLIKSKDSMKQVVDIIADALKQRLPKGLDIDDTVKVDFLNIGDVYENFAKIVATECDIMETDLYVDVTSAPKSAMFVASHLGQLYDITITYIDSKSKRDPIPDVNEFLKLMKDKRSDEGGKWIYYHLHNKSLNDDEKKVLLVLRKQNYDSINGIIRQITGLDENEIIPAKIQRYWARIVYNLEDNQIIRLSENGSKKKSIQLTEIGRGLCNGIYASTIQNEKREQVITR